MTYKEMCEKIEKAKLIRNQEGRSLTAKEIFEYSSTGELYKIPVWYLLARLCLGEITEDEFLEISDSEFDQLTGAPK